MQGVAHQLLSVSSFLALAHRSLSVLSPAPWFRTCAHIVLYPQLPHCTTSVSYSVSLRPAVLGVNPLCDACAQWCPRFVSAETRFLLPCIVINETARPVVDCGWSCLLCVQTVTNSCVIIFIGSTCTFYYFKSIFLQQCHTLLFSKQPSCGVRGCDIKTTLCSHFV
uniref:Putative secreted protein n=1 Tax=Amblyomma cajennense TaxID=34607 RepID=A0A023FE98_AMBCJ